MRRTAPIARAIPLAAAIIAGCASTPAGTPGDDPPESADEPPTAAAPASPRLGNFSVSLAVKDLAASRDFYEKLGFRTFAGDAAQNWLIMQSDSATIGLFQGMFDRNTLTFNPGWDRAANTLADFDDVREIQRILKARGLSPTAEADPSTTGPAYMVIADPDGNPILIDQHIPAPGK